MPRFRSIPLLLAATACLAVAGCGDDEPSTTTSAAAPTTTAQTAPATPTTTAPTTTTDTSGTTTTAPDATTETDAAKKAANPLDKLKEYTKGGQPASEAETAAVRTAMREFSDAVAKRDTKTICSRTIGLDQLMQSSGQKKKITCETMFKASGNTSSPPSKKDQEAIAKGKVTIKGDRATLTITNGVLPMRNVDGVWKIDYGAFAALSAKK